MQSKAKTVDAYLAELPEDRREAIAAVRAVIRKNLPEGYEEGMSYGMIGYHVPHSVYPDGYHCDPKQPLPFAALASQKNHMAIYLMCVYSDPDLEAWFREQWTASGKKLDMGRSCIRFKRLEDVPLAVVGRVVKKVPVEKYVAHYESVVKRPKAGSRRKSRTAKKAGPKARPASRKKVAGKKPAKRA